LKTSRSTPPSGLEDPRLAAPLRVLQPAHGVGRVHGYDLADHHPIEEYSQCGQAQLYRGLGMGLKLRLYKCRYKGQNLHSCHQRQPS
jgi:hypothetical protein